MIEEEKKYLDLLAAGNLPADKHLTDQLDFIYKITEDLKKITKHIALN